MKLHTKSDYINLCADILTPIKKFYSPGCAAMNCGTHGTWYEEAGASVEGFSRPLWALVPLWAAGHEIEDFGEIYIKGITSGTDPENDEYWGEYHDGDQRFVEMAAMAYGLIFAPQKVWEPLSDEAKYNFAQWLYGINNYMVWDSNWIFFRVLVNIGLKSVGREYSTEKLKTDLDRIEEFYVGEGWYRDGVQGQKDYYIPFAIHFYSLIYAIVMEKEDEERCKLFKARAKEFAQQFIYWFADDGAALPYGRSLTYRFAQICFWSACLIADIHPFETGVIKGIIARNLEYWFNNDDVFDMGHVLSVGYKYSSLLMGEHYNAPGSPYWGMKAFAFLMLPDDHEFWSCEALPLPKLDGLKVMKCADMVVTRRDGEVFAYTAGTHNNLGCGQIPAKYLKFAYSTLFGFNVAYSNLSLEEAAPDNMLVFVVDGLVLTRRKNISYEINGDTITTTWSPIKGIEVETTITPIKRGHERTHKIKSDFECTAYDCGFAVSNADSARLKSRTDSEGFVMENVDTYSEIAVTGTRNCEFKEARPIFASPNTNLIHPRTGIPAVGVEIPKGESELSTLITAGRR